jgi:hypothetical protein
LIIKELVMNVSWHTYFKRVTGQVTISYSIPAPGQLQREVADQGKEFDPLAGIFLVRSLSSSIEHNREDAWNRLTFSTSSGA